MAGVTPKENFLKLAGGGTPYYVPYYTMIGDAFNGEASVMPANIPVFDNGGMFTGNGEDMWGIPYAVNETTANAGMPAPNRFILDDIRKWRRVVRIPKALGVGDWEAAAKDALKNIDRSRSCVSAGPGLMPFMVLTGLMGMTEGLCAMYEETDAVIDLLNWMTDIVMPSAEKIMEFIQPDIWSLGDDTCTEANPFFSVEMYKKIYKPIYTRLAKPALDRGIPVIFHCCGRCEDFIPDMLDFGVKYLEPFQETNNLEACKERYRGRLSFIGYNDYGKHVPLNYPNFSEEQIREDVRKTIDRNAKGGAYGYFSWPISYLGDTKIEEVKRIVRDEAHSYGRKVYGYTG